MKKMFVIVTLVALLTITFTSVVLADETGSIDSYYLYDSTSESMLAVAPVIVRLQGGSVEYVFGEHAFRVLVKYGKCSAEAGVNNLLIDESCDCFKVLSKWMKGVSKKDFSKAFIKAYMKADKERDQERKNK